MIYSKNFLLSLDKQISKEKYVKITLMTLDEKPLEQLQGKVTQGSINIDGASALRRTCSLTMITENSDMSNFYWGLNTKFKLEIGVKNTIDSNYPDIIWFNQGVYVITSFNASNVGSQITINLQGKDKMVLLNGELGGLFTSSIDFGKEEWKIGQDDLGNDMTEIVDITIPNIIKEMVHHYGGELYQNIIINDLEDFGLELMEYRGDTPLYILEYQGKTMASFYGDQECTLRKTTKSTFKQALWSVAERDDIYSPDGKIGPYTLKKYEFGEASGYRLTDLTYPGELLASVGENITTILDKIKNVFGDFEYFYNLEGQFVFQKKKTYINSSWSPQIFNETNTEFYIEPDAEAQAHTYEFTDNYLITQINNNPDIANIKNDYSVWGTKKSVTGQELPVHLRYAIHEKPSKYCSVKVTQNEVNNFIKLHPEFTGLQPQSTVEYTAESEGGWRELIYLMSKDYYNYGQFDNFEKKIIDANGNLYPNGKTGYEQYYIDMRGFWRELYDPDKKSEDGYNSRGWNKQILDSPQSLNFWFDFLDPAGELDKYSVSAIGTRPKAVNDKDVKGIYFKEVSPIIFYEASQKLSPDDRKPGYTYVQLINNQLTELFTISSQGKSAKDVVDEWLNNYSRASEVINISGLPIYYLEPNTRIKVFNENLNINGDYLINKITIPLNYNGNMSISASKILGRLY